MIKLTVLIPTLPKRKKLLIDLVNQLEASANDYSVIQHPVINCIIDDNTELTIGAKRNKMLAQVTTPYVVFIDDDDHISRNYVAKLMEGIDLGVDVCSLHGLKFTDGSTVAEEFYHSIKYTSIDNRTGVLYKMPNHLNCMKTELAKQCPFPDWKMAEDSNFGFQLQGKQLLKTEHWIEDMLYFYDYKSQK